MKRLSDLTRIFFLALGLIALTALAANAQSDIVEDARANIERLTTYPAEFDGPTRSPEYEPRKRIVYLSTDERNPVSRAWGEAITEAVEELDWDISVFDGEGNPLEWAQGMTFAVQFGLDGVIMSADAHAVRQLTRAAFQARIPVIGIHAATLPGPDRELSLYTNIQPDPRAVGRAQADWIIAHSDGAARVVIITDCTHPLACAQSTSIENRLADCETCEVLEVYDEMVREMPGMLPEATDRWLSEYDEPLYIVAIADYFVDIVVPALEQANTPTEAVILVGADGNDTAYERIRNQHYQRVTTAEPHELQAYQAVDEMIRAMYGAQPSFWVREPYLVTADNVDVLGGDQDRLIPPYDFKQIYRDLWISEEEAEAARTDG